MKRLLVWLIAVLGAVGAILLWRSTQASAPIEVESVAVRRADIASTFSADGIVHASERRISFKTIGTLSQLYVGEGQKVYAGQLLAAVDSDEIRSVLDSTLGELRAARAARAQAIAISRLGQRQRKAQLASALAGLAAAEAELNRIEAGPRKQEAETAKQAIFRAEAAYALAKKNEERVKVLHEQGAASRAAHESAQTATACAKADLESARQTLNLMEEGARPEEREVLRERVRAARAEVDSVQALTGQDSVDKCLLEEAEARIEANAAKVRQAREALVLANLYAPSEGTVQEVRAEVGETVTPGSPVLVLATREKAYIEAEIADQDTGLVYRGQKVSISLPAYPGRSFAGTVAEIAAHAEIKPDAALRSRIVRVKVHIEEGERELKPGLEVDVRGESIAARNALIVPAKAVKMTEEALLVYVVEGGIARSREVKLGYVSYDDCEVLEGLSVGDRVIVVGRDRVFEGAKVKLAGGSIASK